MATTTATISLSSDLLSSPLALSGSTTCMKAGSSSDGLEQMEVGYLKLASGTNKDLLNADNDSDVGNKEKGNKVYVCNNSTNESTYLLVTIDAIVIGRLYAGDWMFIPWVAEDATADLEITATGGDAIISYAWFHEGKLLTSS